MDTQDCRARTIISFIMHIYIYYYSNNMAMAEIFLLIERSQIFSINEEIKELQENLPNYSSYN